MSVRTSSLVATGMVTLALLGGVTIFGGTLAALINPTAPTAPTAPAPAPAVKAVSPTPAATPPSTPDAGATPTTKDASS